MHASLSACTRAFVCIFSCSFFAVIPIRSVLLFVIWDRDTCYAFRRYSLCMCFALREQVLMHICHVGVFSNNTSPSDLFGGQWDLQTCRARALLFTA